MKVYIFPQQVEQFKHKIELMTKHLETKPQITFSEPRIERRITHTIYDNGWGGRKRTVDYLEVIEVTIDEITQGDWVLVADVFYREGLVTMVSDKYYKQMPDVFGLKYKRCDYCGKEHVDRKESHVIYNPKTNQWKQVGSSCIKKMFNSDYINKFTVQLDKFVEVCSGIVGGEEMFGSWFAKQPDHSWQQALDVDCLASVVVDYRMKVGLDWKKAGWDAFGRKQPGTTEYLNRHFDEHPEIPVDEEFNKGLHEFVNNLSDGEFNNQIKAAFEVGLVQRYNVYKVFFAVKMYQDFLTQDTWEDAKKNCEGKEVEFKNASIIKWETSNSFYGIVEEAIFEYNGLRFKKSCSSKHVLDSFQNEDGTYTFKQMVGYADDKARIFVLKGRARKV